MDAWQHLMPRFTIGWTGSHDTSSSRTTWKNLSALSLIERERLNGNDLHPSVSSKLLIENDEPNPMVTPSFFYKLTCSSTM